MGDPAYRVAVVDKLYRMVARPMKK